MPARARIVRLIAGTLSVIAIAVAILALLSRWTSTWGATKAEVARALPGDERIARAPGDTPHGATIVS